MSTAPTRKSLRYYAVWFLLPFLASMLSSVRLTCDYEEAAVGAAIPERYDLPTE